jgi:hypothetical protein
MLNRFDSSTCVEVVASSGFWDMTSWLFSSILNGNRGSYPIFAQLVVQALSSVLANTDPVAKIVVEEKLVTSLPQPTRHLTSDRPVRGGITDKDVGYPTSPPAKRVHSWVVLTCADAGASTHIASLGTRSAQVTCE